MLIKLTNVGIIEGSSQCIRVSLDAENGTTIRFNLSGNLETLKGKTLKQLEEIAIQEYKSQGNC